MQLKRVETAIRSGRLAMVGAIAFVADSWSQRRRTTTRPSPALIYRPGADTVSANFPPRRTGDAGDGDHRSWPSGCPSGAQRYGSPAGRDAVRLLVAADRLQRRPDTQQPTGESITAANVDQLTLQWSTSAPGRLSEPVTDAGRVYVTHSVSGTSAVRAYELATGSLVWDRALPNTGEPFEVTPPVVFSGENLLSAIPPAQTQRRLPARI